MFKGTYVGLSWDLIRQNALIETVVMPQLLLQIMIVKDIKQLVQSQIHLQLFALKHHRLVHYFQDFQPNVNLEIIVGQPHQPHHHKPVNLESVLITPPPLPMTNVMLSFQDVRQVERVVF